MKTIKLGLIVECTQAGLERVVCPKILHLLGIETQTRIRFQIETMTNKKILIQDAGDTTRLLLSNGCDRVVILWDENPPWTPEQDFANKRCWHIERMQLLSDLANPKLASRTALVCIEREFETWLLHDTQLLRDVISTDAHRAKIKNLPDPLRTEAPKNALIALFQQHRAYYNADVVALKFARCLKSLGQLKRCDTFRYFAQSVLGTMPKGWKPYIYKPKGSRRKA